MAESVEITLKHAIAHGSEEITSLTLREPLLGDFEAMDNAKGEIGKYVHLLARLAGKPPSAVRKLKPADFAQCRDFMDPFLLPLLGSGEAGEDEEGEA